MGLTQDQEQAANDIDNHSLILATAGSGKTKVLIDKVRNILRNNYQSSVLMVTFTNAAVNEMKERLEIALSSSEMARVSVTTFHKAFLDQSRNLLKGKLLIGPTYYNFIDRLRAYLDKEALIPDVKLTNSDVGNIISGQEPTKDYTDDDIIVVDAGISLRSHHLYVSQKQEHVEYQSELQVHVDILAPKNFRSKHPSLGFFVIICSTWFRMYLKRRKRYR